MTPTSASMQERTVDDVIADLDVDQALRDAVPPPMCEMTMQGDHVTCPRPADGLRILRPCGHSVYSCLPCHTAWENGFARNSRRGTVFVSCIECPEIAVPPIEWRPL